MLKRTVLAAAVAILATTGAPDFVAPSFAAGSGSLSPTSGVLYECEDHEYSYSLSLPSDTESWSMDVTIRSEDGLEATSDFVYDVPGSSGTSKFQLCPSDGPGTYTMTAKVEYYDSDYNDASFDLPAAAFDMRFPMTQTTLKVNVKRNPQRKQKIVALRTQTTDERPNGYYGTSYPNVVIQTKRGSTWRTLPNVDLSVNGDGKGFARFVWPIGQRAVLRAWTAPESYDYYTGSYSSEVVVP